MTQTTDAERAHALAEKHGATSYRNRADTSNPAFGFMLGQLEALISEVEQAARRVQVVPEGYALISKDALRAWGKLEIVEQACCYPLSTAPQPPTCNQSMQPLPELATKAEPVQMPEPAGWVDGGGMLFWTEDTPPDGENIYTEHQVRQLLAQHGIK